MAPMAGAEVSSQNWAALDIKAENPSSAAKTDAGSNIFDGVVDVATDSDDSVAGVEVVDLDAESDDDFTVIGDNSAGVPLRFHGYRRGRELGRGASGQVFVCCRRGDPTSYAVKAIDLRRLQLHANAERERKKLCREVEILKRLPPHPNIVQLVNTFEEGDWFLFVLELVGGGDLFTVLTSREPARLQEPEAAFVLRQLADGLTFLHSQGIIHRDLKLENVLVSKSRQVSHHLEGLLVLYAVKITDFGLSKSVGAGFSEACSTVGTRNYMAPEVFGPNLHDFSSDLWCLGVLLYVLLAGHFPYSQMPSKQGDLFTSLDRLVMSRAGKSVVSGLLQLDPNKRLSLEAITGHEWVNLEAFAGVLDDDKDAGRPPKRQRSSKPHPGTKLAESAVMGLDRATESLFGSSDTTRSTQAKDRPIESLDAMAVVDSSLQVEIGSAAQAAGKAPVVHAAEIPASWNSATRTSTSVARPSAQAVPPTLPPPANGDIGENEASASQVDAAPAAGSSTVARVRSSDVCFASQQPDVMQVHISVPGSLAEAFLGNGQNMRQLAQGIGCQVQMRSRKGVPDQRVIIIGNYNQCAIAQEVLFGRLSTAARDHGVDLGDEIEVVLLVRAEAVGVVIGKQGWMLKQIHQSGADIELLREELRGQRPCVLRGPLQSVLRAERHVFDLVRAIPVTAAAEGASSKPLHRKKQAYSPQGPNLPRSHCNLEPCVGKVVSWKGRVGWIEPEEPIDHPKASSHHGKLYIHEQDIVGGGPLTVGQKVVFQLYEDKTGLGAEQCRTV